VVDDGHPAAELVGLLHVVGGEEDGLALAVQLLHDLVEGQAALGVEAGGRLVEEEDVGLVHDRPGHHEPLGHAAGQREHRGVGEAVQLDAVDEAVGGGLGRLARHPEEPPVEDEVLLHGEAAVERVRLRDDADDPLGLGRRGDDVDPAHHGAARRRDDPGGQHPGGRRLAGAVGAEQAEDLAAAHRQVEVGHGPDVARVHLGQRTGGDDLVVVVGGGHGRHAASRAGATWWWR
jgi:hypothetical protein